MPAGSTAHPHGIINISSCARGTGTTIEPFPHLNKDEALTVNSLREWCRDHLSTYKIPKQLLVLEALPRNAMGKVTKPAVRDLFG